MATESKKVICINGCSKATRVAKDSDEFRSKPNTIVTIDFGTTHCSVSYLTSIKACPDPSAMEPVLLNLDSESRKRIPSCILFDQLGGMKSFGYQARDQYAKLPITDRPACAFFEHVKKEIQRTENVERDNKIQAINGKQYFLIEVIAHTLCYLKDRVLGEIRKFGLQDRTPEEVTDIDWVITVPAIWKARGKRMMREAGYMAGLCDPHVTMGKLEEAAGRVQPTPKEESNPEKLSLALEPESAAIKCMKAILTSQKDESGTNDVEYYLIVDCGGGTVDIATHGIINGHVMELATSAGNMSGGITINERFRNFLSCVVDDPDFARYFSECDDLERSGRMSEINKIVYTLFEDQKVCFGNHGYEDTGNHGYEDSFVVEFPFAFAKHFGQVMENKTLDHKNVKIEDDGSRMRLYPAQMAMFFEPTIDEIGKVICDHIDANDLASTIDTLFWVGGFGGCQYLQNQLKKKIDSKFKVKIRYSCPSEPQLAVVKGALAFRCDPSVIQQRKADATYGIECKIPFDKRIHQKNFCVDDTDNPSQKWCKNIFSTFIERDESICTNEVFVTDYSPSSQSQEIIELTFYSAPHANVWYTTDRDVTKIAKMDVNIAGYGRDRKIEVVFDVTHTEIQVCARDKQSRNEYKIVVDFLSSEK